MTYLAPPAQAALAAVLRHTGPGFVGTELTVTDGADGWSVAVTGRVDGAVRMHQVVVRTEPGAPAIQSCSAEVAGRRPSMSPWWLSRARRTSGGRGRRGRR